MKLYESLRSNHDLGEFTQYDKIHYLYNLTHLLKLQILLRFWGQYTQYGLKSCHFNKNY